MTDNNDPKPDKFFISYNKEDKKWATWISWILSEAGHEVFIQAWDIRPGNNFVIAMQDAASSNNRTIAVLSEQYLAAKYTQPEWASAFNQDPTGEKGTLLPVKVEKVKLDGLWLSIVYIDLVGLSEEEAKKALLEGISLKRAKPILKPTFPGKQDQVFKNEPSFPATFIEKDPLKDWTVLQFIVYDQNNEKLLISSIRGESSRIVTQSENKYWMGEIASHLLEDSKSKDKDDDSRIYRILFNLLVPISIGKGLSDGKRICIIVDRITAMIPWEGIIAYSNSILSIPLQQIPEIIRKFVVSLYRENPHDKHQHSALIIEVSNIVNIYQKVRSINEARSISDILKNASFKVESQIESSVSEIIESLFTDTYQILHIEGIGYFENEDRVGIAIGKDIYLTPRELSQMELIPELVYINFGLQQIFSPNDKKGNEEIFNSDFLYCQLAATFAKQLVDMGVKSIIISSLPLDEKTSLTFSNEFYQTLLDGETFSLAIKRAKQKAFEKEPSLRTLASFQCYGDENFCLNNFEKIKQ